MKRLSWLCLLVSFVAGCDKPPVPADLILTGGKIVTMDPLLPEVRALAVSDGEIKAIGSEVEIRRYGGPATRILELNGRTAIPGFIDSHGHFMGIGQARMSLDVMHVRNWDEIIAKVAEAAKTSQPGEWITGRGWHQEKWDARPSPEVEGFPVHEALSRVSPNNPVVLTHASGHATFVNAKALGLCGITGATPDPPGGEILKDRAGNPTGLLRETASGLVRKGMDASLSQRTAEQVEATARRQVELAVEECLSRGVTSFHDAGVGFDTVELYRLLADEGKLGVRLYVMLRESVPALERNRSKFPLIDYGDRRLTVRAIKRSIDGALGPRGAWLLAPYADLPSSSGLNTSPIEEMHQVAKFAIENGWQLCVHAIGDRANRETLDVFEKAFREHPEKRDLRWRDEHAQHISASDIGRFNRLGVIAAMQGIHCTSDAPYVLARLGPERAREGAYVWQKLMRTGVIVSNGTDAPVEDVDPIDSYYASVTRKLKDGSVFFGDQRMSRIEALRSYTLNGAYAAFQEKQKGSLSPGKLADIVILSQDITTVPDAQIRETRVMTTLVGGRIVFQLPGTRQ